MTHLRDELDGYLSVRVSILKIVDELRQVLDGIDVVVRRRRDQTHSRSCVAVLCDILRYLCIFVSFVDKNARMGKTDQPKKKRALFFTYIKYEFCRMKKVSWVSKMPGVLEKYPGVYGLSSPHPINQDFNSIRLLRV